MCLSICIKNNYIVDTVYHCVKTTFNIQTLCTVQNFGISLAYGSALMAYNTLYYMAGSASGQDEANPVF